MIGVIANICFHTLLTLKCRFLKKYNIKQIIEAVVNWDRQSTNGTGAIIIVALLVIIDTIALPYHNATSSATSINWLENIFNYINDLVCTLE